jgi:hypothetical protein
MTSLPLLVRPANRATDPPIALLSFLPSLCAHTPRSSPRTIWQTFEAYHICLAALFPAMLNW